MTRAEYNEFRYIASNLRKHHPTWGCTCTIRTNASESYKRKLDKLYCEYNMHPASIRIDRRMYDDNERIIYLYGRDEQYRGYGGRTYNWEGLYSAEEKSRFAEALTDRWNH